MSSILKICAFISYTPIYFKTIVIDISILFWKWRESSPVPGYDLNIDKHSS